MGGGRGQIKRDEFIWLDGKEKLAENEICKFEIFLLIVWIL